MLIRTIFLFFCVLISGKVPHDDSLIEKMCEVTGGRSYRVKSHYVLNQCIESLVQKVQPGVVVHFDQLMPKDLKDGEVQDISFGNTKKMIYVQKHPTQKTFPVGFWPIPEPYWPDPKANSLPPRDAHPKIRIVTPCVDEPQLIRNFPVDRYEVEASPLTLQILSKREQNKCWPVIISNGIHSLEMPFGYLKASANFTQVHLVVLPYNYPILLPLLHDLLLKYAPNPPSDWIYKFSAYVRSIPQYYGPFLRRALGSANVPYQLLQYILPENLDSYLSPAVANYLKTMKNTAKQEQENMCLRVLKQLKLPKPPYHQVETTKLNVGLPLKKDLVTHPQLKETFSKLHNLNTFENYTIIVPTVQQQSSTKNYRNPFDVPRRDLIDEIVRMRENFLKLPTSGINLYTKDAGHCLPISEMGNYQEYLKNKQSPLREIEPTNVRQHMFGNPYKKDKHMVMVDEADLGEMAPMKPNANTPKKAESTNRTRKRKAGPIRKDYIFRRISTDSQDSIASPSRSTDTDTDDDMSDTSSTRTDEESDNDLIIDFEFNEPSNEEDFNVNGHVQSFINGDIEDTDEPQPMLSIPSPVIPSSSFMAQLPPITPPQPPPMPPPPLHHPVMPVISGPVGNSIGSVGFVNGPSQPINDFETQEISKILQQCHNGMDAQRFHDKEEKPEKRSISIDRSNSDNDTTQHHNNNENTENRRNDTKKDALDFDERDEEQKENIKQSNMQARTVIFKDIRRPGRDYTQLLEHLNLVKGNLETRFSFVQMCITESLRFRRKKMADCIQEWWDKQIDKLNAASA